MEQFLESTAANRGQSVTAALTWRSGGTEGGYAMTKRSLIVDDGALIALTAVRMVEALGYEAVEAHSGAEALEVLGSGKAFDLIITDQSMPGMSGSELAREAKLMKPDLAIMVSTGYSDVPEGFDDYVLLLSKPYSDVELSTKFATAIG